MFAVPPATIPYAAWPPMMAGFALAAVLFGASALQMVADGFDGPGGDVRLKAGIPPVVLRNMPSVEPAAAPPPKVPVVKVVTAAADVPQAAFVAAPTQAVHSPDVADSPDAAVSSLAPAAQLVVIGDVTVHAEPRTQSRPVGTLHRGDAVEVAARAAGWILVRQGGSLGWVWGEFLAPA